jgi:hypothetical protein
MKHNSNLSITDRVLFNQLKNIAQKKTLQNKEFSLNRNKGLSNQVPKLQAVPHFISRA